MRSRVWIAAAVLVALGLAGAALALGPGWGTPAWGAMGGWGRMGSGCSGAWTAVSSGERISFEEAVTAVERYLARLPGDFEVDHVMAFERNYYVTVHEAASGRGAFELLVHPITGAVGPEPGPNMMWNTEYGMMGGPGGMMGGMMGGFRGGWGARGAAATVLDEAAAMEAAARWLARTYPQATLTMGVAFPGYYTFDFERARVTAGMVSVNAYTGQVWYHDWHGAFIEERDLGEDH